MLTNNKVSEEKNTKYLVGYTVGNFRAVNKRTGEVIFRGTEYECDQYCNNEEIQLWGSLIKKEE